MKCDNCHAEILDNPCPYCGHDREKSAKALNRFNKFIFGILRIDGLIGRVGVVLFILLFIEFFITDEVSALSGILGAILIIVSVVLSLIGVLFAITVALSMFFPNLKKLVFKNRLELIDGYVVDNKSLKEIHNGGKGFFPIIEFEYNATKYRIIGQKYSDKKIPLDTVYKIRFNSENPHASFEEDTKELAKVVFFGFLILFIIILIIVI